MNTENNNPAVNNADNLAAAYQEYERRLSVQASPHGTPDTLHNFYLDNEKAGEFYGMYGKFYVRFSNKNGDFAPVVERIEKAAYATQEEAINAIKAGWTWLWTDTDWVEAKIRLTGLLDAMPRDDEDDAPPLTIGMCVGMMDGACDDKIITDDNRRATQFINSNQAGNARKRRARKQWADRLSFVVDEDDALTIYCDGRRAMLLYRYVGKIRLHYLDNRAPAAFLPVKQYLIDPKAGDYYHYQYITDAKNAVAQAWFNLHEKPAAA